MSVLDEAPTPATRRRRSYKPAPERREQILDCALEVFGARGYHKTTIADVCQKAGIGRGTLYQYFRDKRDLLAAVAERIASRVIEHHARRRAFAYPKGIEPDERAMIRVLEQRFVEALEIVFEDAATARLVAREGRGADGVVDDILRRIDGAVLGAMERELQAAIDAGFVRPLDVKLTVRFFLGGFEKVVLSYLDEDRPVDIHAIAHEAALLEVSGIFPRKPTEPPP